MRAAILDPILPRVMREGESRKSALILMKNSHFNRTLRYSLKTSSLNSLSQQSWNKDSRNIVIRVRKMGFRVISKSLFNFTKKNLFYLVCPFDDILGFPFGLSIFTRIFVIRERRAKKPTSVGRFRRREAQLPPIGISNLAFENRFRSQLGKLPNTKNILLPIGNY